MEIQPKKHLVRKHNHTRNDPFFWLHKKNMNLIKKLNKHTVIIDFFYAIQMICKKKSIMKSKIEHLKMIKHLSANIINTITTHKSLKIKIILNIIV